MIGARLRVGVRGSRLAMAQAQLVVTALAAHGAAAPVELVAVRTRGDAISARNPRGGVEATDGQFSGELEQAVLRGDVDVAVHSYKDLPTDVQLGTQIVAVLPRGDARDCLLARGGLGLDELPPGAVVGSSSVRRIAQLRIARPDLVARPVRGNVETRVRRMQRGEYDAVVLACAGLDRLGMELSEAARLSFDVMLPAPAQAALAVQVRDGRHDLAEILRPIDDRPTRIAVEAERALLRTIGGGCRAPLGTLGEVRHGRLRLRAADVSDVERPRRVDVQGAADDWEGVVAEAARRLLAATGGAA